MMQQWYYVVGTERMGPVDEGILRSLFVQQNISKESYVWCKGLENWLRLKDVKELAYFYEEVAPTPMPMPMPMPVPTSSSAPAPAANHHVQESSSLLPFPETLTSTYLQSDDESTYFLRIGLDRSDAPVQESMLIYGPYSKDEVEAAILHKRINQHTLVYQQGEVHWCFLYQREEFKSFFMDHLLNSSKKEEMIEDLIPRPQTLILRLDHELHFHFLLKERHGNEGVLLSIVEGLVGKCVEAALYSGDKMVESALKLEFRDHSAWWQAYRVNLL